MTRGGRSRSFAAATLGLTLGLMLGLLLGLAPLAGPATAKQVLTPDELRVEAMIALRAGVPQQALTYADALLSRDPADLEAKLIRARALRDLGRNPEARSAAWDAQRSAQTDEEKFTAALIMAQVQSSAGRKTLGQYWLRRAVELAPSDGARARAIRDFKYLRATNPWSTKLNFSITPDSNINDGSANETSFLNYEQTELLFGRQVEYQLAGAALALPGIEYALGVDTRYRAHQTELSAHDLFFKADLRTYTLSSEARETAPDVSGSDFAFASVFAGYGYRWLGAGKKGETALRLDLGHSWYGGDDYAQYLRGAVHHAYILSPVTKLGGSFSGERQFGIYAPDVDTGRLSVWGAHRLDSGHAVSWSVTGGVTSSPSKREEFEELRLRLGLVLPEPVFGATAQFGLGLRGRDYDISPHSRDGRQDREIRGDMTLIFTQMDYHGFNPTVTFYGSKKTSNISLYESNKLGVNFGIQSAF